MGVSVGVGMRVGACVNARNKNKNRISFFFPVPVSNLTRINQLLGLIRLVKDFQQCIIF